LEDLGVKGRIIFKKILKKQNGGVECIDLALDRDTWCALMKEVMNLRVPYVVTLSEQLLASNTDSGSV
jgi:hypothetical protein